MMSEFRRIMMSSFLMLLLHFTAANGKPSSFIVRDGGEVTLPCDNVKNYQDKCNSTTWIFSDSRGSAAVELVEHGQIGKEAKAKSDRLRVTEKCSLVLKKVTEEDAGLYIGRQFRSGEQQGPGSPVYLSVVTMTEHQNNDEVTLSCSVTRRGDCRLSVKWLLQGQDVDKDNREIKTSQSSCSASVTFQTSLFSYTSWSELLSCAVRHGANVQTFSPQSSGEDTKPATPTTTTTTTTAKPDLNAGWWWWIIVVIVGVAALTIITVSVIRRKRTQGTDTETDVNVAHDDEDDEDDEDEAVTYSTVRAPSSSCAASADPSLLYATVNTPKE